MRSQDFRCGAALCHVEVWHIKSDGILGIGRVDAPSQKIMSSFVWKWYIFWFIFDA